MSSPGIKQVDGICWRLVTEHGYPVCRGDEQHYASEADAAKDVGRWHMPSAPDPTPAIMAGPCFIAVAHCGMALDENADGIIHWESDEVAARAAADWGWATKADGLVCSDDCDDCAIALREAGVEVPEWRFTCTSGGDVDGFLTEYSARVSLDIHRRSCGATHDVEQVPAAGAGDTGE